MSLTDVSPEEFASSMRNIQASVYVDLASFTLVVYDYLMTFEDERILIWPAHWTITKVFFLLTRYAPFVDASITLVRHFTRNMSTHACALNYKIGGCLINAGIVIAELILLQRTRAIWGNTKQITVILVIWLAMAAIPDAIIMVLFLRSIKFTPLPPGFSDCLVTSGNRLLMGSWIILMIFEAGILAALVIKWVQYYNEQKGMNELANLIFKNGSIFYVYIFCLSVANVAVISRLSRDLENMLASITRVTHALLTARLILTLNSSVRRTEVHTHTMSSEDVQLDSIGFETNVLQCTEFTDSTIPSPATWDSTLPSTVTYSSGV